MQYQLTRQEKGKVEIKVDIPQFAFQEAYNITLAKLGKNTNIAGFRPGNVPVDVLEQHLGLNKILNEAASSQITKHLSEIFKKEDIVPLDSPKVAIESLAKDSPFSFTVSFTQKPQIKVGDWKKIKVQRIKAAVVTDEDINQSIKNIFEAAKKQKETGNKKQETREEESSDTNKSGKFIYDAHGNKVFFDKKTLRSSPAAPDAGLKIFLKSDTSEVKTPHTSQVKREPDDEFAKSIGARDLVHLRELVKKDLETIIADQVEMKLDQQIFEEISKISDVGIPDILIEDELNRMLIRLTSELERQSKKLDDYLTEQKTTIDELKNKWRDPAAKNVKITLVLNEIGKSENVKVEKEEVDKALASVNQTNLSTDQKADLENYLVVNIFQAKTLDLVKKTVTA